MDKIVETKNLQLVNNISELPEVARFVDSFAEDWDVPVKLAVSLNLVLEEALTNIIFYAFDDDRKHTIDVCAERGENELRVTISDDGKSYDPLRKNDPDFEVPLEERTIGGLGVFLIKKIMDKVEYQRRENKNYLILTKSL